ncbi:MAG: hypothetical protein IH840_00565 [Candidatus Heimdallarchaeota archaeon]|nr:hypothetical protein [Candidatus Heimdallarchaeota archaeon]
MAEDLTIALLVLAFLLGIKHSMDVDHVVAISSFMVRSENILKSSKLSIAWALGHMVTASIITFLLFTFKSKFLGPLLANFDLLVGIMLLTIGILTIAWEFNIIKIGKHQHGQDLEHQHIYLEKTGIPNFETISYKGEFKTLSGIGLIHGLASNDELLLLLTLTLGLSNVSSVLLGVLVFTLGVVLGMIMYGTALKLPIQKFGRERVIRTINLTLAALTIMYAIYILVGGEALNLTPFIKD